MTDLFIKHPLCANYILSTGDTEQKGIKLKGILLDGHYSSILTLSS